MSTNGKERNGATRLVTVHLSPADAVTLSGLAVHNGQSLCEACRLTLVDLAVAIRNYDRDFKRLVGCDTDLPADVPAAVREVETLLVDGLRIARFTGDEFLHLDAVNERLYQLCQLRRPRIEIEIPANFEEDDGS